MNFDEKTDESVRKYVAITCFFFLACLICFALEIYPEKKYLPAWVQAVGSVAAIIAAIWVAHSQHKKQLKIESNKRNAEVQTMLFALNAEIAFAHEHYKARAGHTLCTLQDKKAFNSNVSVIEPRFPVFNAYIGRIGLLENQSDIAEIINAYVLFSSFLNCLETNNKLLLAYKTAEEKNHSPEMIELYELMVLNTDTLKKAWGTADNFPGTFTQMLEKHKST